MKIAKLLAALAACSVSFAAGLSLEECVQSALENNNDIKALKSAYEASTSRTNQIRSAYFPQINGSFGFSRTVTPLSTSFGSLLSSIPGLSSTSDVITYSAAVSAQMIFYDFGRTGASEKQAFLGEQSALLRYEQKKQEIGYNVKKAYYGLLQAGALAALSEVTKNEMKSLYDSVKERYSQGVATPVDTLNAESEYVKFSAEASKARRRLELAADSLALVLGKKSGENVRLSGETLPAIEAAPLGVTSLEKCFALALMNKLDFQASDLSVESAAASIAGAYSDWLPSLSGNARYDLSGTQFPLDQGGYSYGVTLNIPLFSGFSSSAKLAAAEADRKNAVSSAASLKEALLLQVKTNYYGALDKSEDAAAANKKQEYLEKNYEAMKAKYDVGLTSITDLIDAESKKAAGVTDSKQALFNYRMQVNELEYSIGGVK